MEVDYLDENNKFTFLKDVIYDAEGGAKITKETVEKFAVDSAVAKLYLTYTTISSATLDSFAKIDISAIKETNTEKAKACYDWIIKNVEYHDYGFANWVSLIVVLNDKQGNPFDFAYTYYSMLKYICIDAKFVTGHRSLEAGGNSMHAWVTVDIDGVTYYFDPFTDNNNAELQNSETCYDCFMKTDEEVEYRYVANE